MAARPGRHRHRRAARRPAHGHDRHVDRPAVRDGARTATSAPSTPTPAPCCGPATLPRGSEGIPAMYADQRPPVPGRLRDDRPDVGARPRAKAAPGRRRTASRTARAPTSCSRCPERPAAAVGGRAIEDVADGHPRCHPSHRSPVRSRSARPPRRCPAARCRRSRRKRLKVGHTGITWGFKPTDAEQAIKDVGSLGFAGYESFGNVLEYWDKQGGLEAKLLDAAQVPLQSAYCPVDLTDPAKRQGRDREAGALGRADQGRRRHRSR